MSESITTSKVSYKSIKTAGKWLSIDSLSPTAKRLFNRVSEKRDESSPEELAAFERAFGKVTVRSELVREYPAMALTKRGKRGRQAGMLDLDVSEV